jgi:ribosome biogenesis GTPase
LDESDCIDVHQLQAKITDISNEALKVPPKRSQKRLQRGAEKQPNDAVIEDDERPLVQSEQIRSAHEDRSRARRKLSRKRERGVLIAQTSEPQDLKLARVIGAEGAYFVLRLIEGEDIRAKTYKGTRSANANSTLVAIGDDVRVSVKLEDVSIIEEVLARRTKLARKAAGRRAAFEQVVVANIDLLVIVASATQPPLRAGIIDRYIVAALEGGMAIALAINKIDVASPEEMEEVLYFRDVYEELGYPVAQVSAANGEGLPDLKALIAAKTSVFAGHSGVGKSSLINALLGEDVGRTGALSKKYRRGAHTTSSSVLLSLEGAPGAYVADTPGVREFANFELDSQNLKFSFVEFAKYQEHCRVTNCSHLHEPGCAVRQALEEDKISIERYVSYEKLFEEAQAAERKRLYNQ